MKFSTILAGIATFSASLVAASPIQERQVTGFQVTNFFAACSGPPDHCDYSATLTSIPDGAVITASHTRSGVKTFPAASGFWTTSNPSVQIRINDSLGGDKRIAITDARIIGSSMTYSHIAPNGQWPINAAGYQSYSGPTSFVANNNPV
ncbi:hypothetical protein B0H63DRAFT_561611 [Podospora didyma]|uniref:Uncharacterized protein n=1 Tax=Podospora didyma TaxID=330526 RepID=A0AAE0KK96_9PEZI|nr:hypothetical protein B0H63DRAFT_561611 [Podospora didyma]